MGYTEEILEKIGIRGNIGIHDLRNKARAMGVKNPTANKKKDDLIREMIDIAEGRTKPVMPSKRGRPPLSGAGDTFMPPHSRQPFNADILETRKAQGGYASGTNIFEGFKPVFPAEKLEDTFSLLQGQRALFVSHEASDALKTLKSLIASINSPLTTTLMIDAAPEIAADFSEAELAGDKIISPLGLAPVEHIKTASFYLSQAKQVAASGKNAVLIVYYFDALYRAFCAVNPTGAISAAASFFGAGRKLEDSGSLTMIAFVKDGASMLNDTLNGLANMKVVLTRDELIDGQRSYKK